MGNAGLDFDLGNLPWAESDVDEGPSTGGTSQPDGTRVFVTMIASSPARFGT